MFFFLFLLGVAVFYKSLMVFFVQDDFILINHFSQNSLIIDVKSAIGSPEVTHWRPMHNLYFLIAGNIFYKNYSAYHFFTLLIHAGVAFLIFKIANKITNNLKIAYVSSFIYAIHPAHFVTLFWISGSATSIGFFFLLLSFLLYLQEKKRASIFSFLLSLLASEAMIAGFGLFVIYQFLFRDRKIINLFTGRLLMAATIFALIRLLFLTPKSTYDSYQINIWPQIFTNTKYYLLRVAGFAEVSGDLIVSIALLGLLLFTAINIARGLKYRSDHRVIIFALSLIILGLFPFVLISNLSPHYMNISVFGLALLISISLSKLRLTNTIAFLLIFLLLSFLNVRKTYQDHWVIKRSDLSEKYIHEIENSNIPEESMIIFNDNYISTSEDAYISLGTGKAIDFWFGGKNYQYCFTAFESCEEK